MSADAERMLGAVRFYGADDRFHGIQGYRQRYDRIAELGQGAWLPAATVMDTTAHLVDATEMWRRALEALQRDPLYFVDAAAEPQTLWNTSVHGTRRLHGLVEVSSVQRRA